VITLIFIVSNLILIGSSIGPLGKAQICAVDYDVIFEIINRNKLIRPDSKITLEFSVKLSAEPNSYIYAVLYYISWLVEKIDNGTEDINEEIYPSQTYSHHISVCVPSNIEPGTYDVNATLYFAIYYCNGTYIESGEKTASISIKIHSGLLEIWLKISIILLILGVLGFATFMLYMRRK